ncbi:hypothetical protein H4R34_000123 [Dimargaris verticillata]|uniref:PHD-type domain-containing protein n=1 Tax=Dimargaris verticillata TaxID=2761393 RepID=A0A9W8EG89_9FUNG|nr:hypothetical protein H4R34_000123 [Dimargaris verticillata]
MSSRGLSSSPAPKGSHDTLAVCSGEDSDSWSHQIKKKYAALSRSVTLPELVRKCKSNPPLPPRKVSKRNNETCEVCGDEGRFVCCDACPRVFHFLCLNPPLSETVIASQSIWYCPVCRERPSTTKVTLCDTRFNIFAPLIDKLEHRCPKAFVPPKHIVDEFEGVAANSLGEYVNTLENRPLRSGAPPANKKWMCPNHAAHAMPVSRRWKRTRVVKVDQGMPFATGGQIRVIDDDEDAEIAIYRRLKKARLAMRHDTSLAPQDDSGNRNIEYMVNSSSIKRAFCLRTRSRRVVSSDTDFAYSASLSRLFDDRLTSAPYRPSKLTTTEEFQQQVADLISARVTTALPTTDRIGLLLKAALNPTPAQPAMEDHVPHSACISYPDEKIDEVHRCRHWEMTLDPNANG